MRAQILLLLAMCHPVVADAVPEHVRAQVESSMLVSGTLDIDREGRASGAMLDMAGQLPPGVIELVDAAAAKWRFEPVLVDGRVANVRTRMSLRVVATQAEGDTFTLSLRSASFGLEEPEGSPRIHVRSRKPPVYPEMAVRQGIQGTVYALARVGRDGRVEDVVAEQVNLYVYGSERQMKSARSLLADATLRAVRQWRFEVAADADPHPYRLVRAPVTYVFSVDLLKASHQWESYVPGPRTSPPWAMDASRSTGAPDALPEGGLSLLGNGPRLLTELAD